MGSRKDRIIIDTNLWISFLLTKDFAKLDTLLANKEVTLIFSIALLEELVDVTGRRKFKKYFNPSDVENILLQIESRSDFILVESEVDICRDPKDNFLLSLAIDGKATHLITGDKDLLILEKIETTDIVTMTKYLSNR